MKYLFILLFPISVIYSQSSLKLQNDIKVSLKPSEQTGYLVSANTSSLNPEKKKTILGIIYSFILPGMGEYYAGDYSTGKYFTIADGAFWGTYLGMSYYSSHLRDNYITYSRSNGGTTGEGKDDDYYANIGNYRDIYQYNDEMAFQRRFDEMYDENTHFWKWNTTGERKSYRNMWVSSQQTKNSLRFVVGAAILNRVASTVNAVRLIVRHNKGLEKENMTSVTVDYSHFNQSVNLNLVTNF
ncbi:MAG: hypothetical protein HUU54_10715 [Ignavibacteriaceae bacterium]|nr:hypothetical protein [Ignavibacteriaceae bacterium]